MGADDNVDDQPDGEDAGEVLEEEEGGGQASDKQAEGHQPREQLLTVHRHLLDWL